MPSARRSSTSHTTPNSSRNFGGEDVSPVGPGPDSFGSRSQGGGSLFRAVLPGEERLTIALDSVSVLRGNAKIVDNCTAMIRGGRVTAIVSCCGSRVDSLLLNALAQHEDYVGNFVASGVPIVAPKYRRAACFVSEDLTTIDELTVRENIAFSVDLRVGNISDSADLINEVVTVVGLNEDANKPVKKCRALTLVKLWLAKELVLDPSVILIESPLDFLKSSEATQFLRILREVALSGRVVVLSMVQPRWSLLRCTDDLLLFERGTAIYCGETDELMAMMQRARSSDDDPEATLGALYRTASSPDLSLVEDFRALGNHLVVRQNVDAFLAQCACGEVAFNAPQKFQPPNPFIQFLYLLKYYILQLQSQVVFVLAFIVILLALSVFLAVIYTSQAGQSGMQNRVGIIYIVISVTFLVNIWFLHNKKRTLVSFQRHRDNGYYNTATFLCYWVITNAAIIFVCSVVFILVLYSLSNIDSDWNMNSLQHFAGIVAITSFCNYMTVWLVVCVVPSLRAVHFILFGIYTFNAVLAGIMLNLRSLPKFFRSISYASFIRLGYESALLSQFSGQDFGCNATALPPSSPMPTPQPSLQPPPPTTPAPSSSLVDPATLDGVPPRIVSNTTACYTGDMYLEFLGFKEDRKWLNVQIMAIATGGIIVLCFLAMLKVRHRARRITTLDLAVQ